MREVEPTWSGAVLVCTHERDPTKGKAWCGKERGTELRDWLKRRMKAAGLKGVVLTAKSGCLGVCSPLGVTVSVLPAGESGLPRRMWVFENGDDREMLLKAVHLAVMGAPLTD